MAFSECPSFPIRPDRWGLEKAGAIEGLRIAPTRSSTMSGRNKRLSMHQRELRESIRASRAGAPATSTPGMTSAAAGAAAASRSRRSSKPRSTGSTGSIIAGCSSHRQHPIRRCRKPILCCRRHRQYGCVIHVQRPPTNPARFRTPHFPKTRPLSGTGRVQPAIAFQIAKAEAFASPPPSHTILGGHPCQDVSQFADRVGLVQQFEPARTLLGEHVAVAAGKNDRQVRE